MNGCAKIDEGTRKITDIEVQYFKSAWRSSKRELGRCDAMRSACSLQAQSSFDMQRARQNILPLSAFLASRDTLDQVHWVVLADASTPASSVDVYR